MFLQGCNFDCIACHNPQTIPLPHGDHFRTTVNAVIDRLRQAAPFVRGITVSGGEATLQPDFLHALFATVKADPQLSRLTCFVDSNGSADEALWRRLAPVMDGVMIDLKCLDPEIHRSMTSQPNDAVLASIDLLQSLGLLYEVRLLLLKGVNDDVDLLRRTAERLAAIDPTMRVKVIGFRRHGARPQPHELVEPTPDDLDAASDVLSRVAPFDICLV